MRSGSGVIARNQVKRGFYFSLERGDIIKVSHNSADEFKSARNGGGFLRIPTFKFLPGMVINAAALPAEIEEWTAAESPEITI